MYILNSGWWLRNCKFAKKALDKTPNLKKGVKSLLLMTIAVIIAASKSDC
jgi:hypothetical protein